MNSVPNSIVITPSKGALSASDDIIRSRILTMRGVQVILDRDIAMLYGVETKVLNQAVKRNRERFPDRFMFQLTGEELVDWKSQIVTSNPSLEQTIRMGVRRAPYAFTEQGEALKAGAEEIIVAHNHPSGDWRPGAAAGAGRH